MNELLTPTEMAEAERSTIDGGDVDGYGLMRRAGEAVFRELLARFPQATGFDVLSGPGNNGGDGYVVARLLAETGLPVELWAEGEPRPGRDAERAARECALPRRRLEDFQPSGGRVIVDALFGAGLTRSLSGAAERAALSCSRHREVVSIDLPSGVSGETGAAAGAFKAVLTVTFVRMKPGHLLYPGREHCGEVVVADIGVPDGAIPRPTRDRPRTFVNRPSLWRGGLDRPETHAHKYARGHVAVFSGGALSTGAARLAASAAARSGAGAVTLLSPSQVLAINAGHLTATMLARADTVADLDDFLDRRRPLSAVIGPGFGNPDKLRAFVLHMLGRANHTVLGDGLLRGGLVLDADAISAFAEDPARLFDAVAAIESEEEFPAIVLTPHEGEFRRLFPDIAADEKLSRLEKARLAADRSRCAIVYKGADTIIACPTGRAAINENGTPWLATAGSGDVLAGIIGGMLTQNMPLFDAACAAVWIHAEAARRFGAGLIAEDLPGLLPSVLGDLIDRRL